MFVQRLENLCDLGTINYHVRDVFCKIPSSLAFLYGIIRAPAYTRSLVTPYRLCKKIAITNIIEGNNFQFKKDVYSFLLYRVHRAEITFTLTTLKSIFRHLKYKKNSIFLKYYIFTII